MPAELDHRDLHRPAERRRLDIAERHGARRGGRDVGHRRAAAARCWRRRAAAGGGGRRDGGVGAGAGCGCRWMARGAAVASNPAAVRTPCPDRRERARRHGGAAAAPVRAMARGTAAVMTRRRRRCARQLSAPRRRDRARADRRPAQWPVTATGGGSAGAGRWRGGGRRVRRGAGDAAGFTAAVRPGGAQPGGGTKALLGSAGRPAVGTDWRLRPFGAVVRGRWRSRCRSHRRRCRHAVDAATASRGVAVGCGGQPGGGTNACWDRPDESRRGRGVGAGTRAARPRNHDSAVGDWRRCRATGAGGGGEVDGRRAALRRLRRGRAAPSLAAARTPCWDRPARRRGRRRPRTRAGADGARQSAAARRWRAAVPSAAEPAPVRYGRGAGGLGGGRCGSRGGGRRLSSAGQASPAAAWLRGREVARA